MEGATHSFSPERLERIARMEEWHFWFRGRRAYIESWLTRIALSHSERALDIGCGTGWMVRWLASKGVRSIGLDSLAPALARLRAYHPTLSGVQGDAERLPFRAASVSLILCLDVLEHLDDRQALQEAWRVLTPGGWLILAVPAVPGLWSARDEAAGHRRRYTRALLRQRLQEAGFCIVDLRFYMFLLFPLIALTRWLGRFRPSLQEIEERPPSLLNSMLSHLLRLEIGIGRHIPWPWGSTLLALARKAC